MNSSKIVIPSAPSLDLQQPQFNGAPPSYDIYPQKPARRFVDNNNFEQINNHSYGRNSYDYQPDNRIIDINHNSNRSNSICNGVLSTPNRNQIIDIEKNQNLYRNNIIQTAEDKLNYLTTQYNIHELFTEHLSLLKNYKIVVCLDDSSSMNESIVSTPNLVNSFKSPTRYDEIKSIIKIIIDMSMIYDEGIDLYFLNKNPVYDITNYKQIEYILNKTPGGHTPLKHIAKQIFLKYKYETKPVLVVFATDGIPTDINGNEKLVEFVECLKKRNTEKYYLSFLSCSDRDEDNYYLKKLNKNTDNLSVLDTYSSEKNIITNIKGRSFRYTLGDHIARLLLTPIVEKIDIIEELNLLKNAPSQKNSKSKRFRNKQTRVRKNRKNGGECSIL
jgi:hypothetical protein